MVLDITFVYHYHYHPFFFYRSQHKESYLCLKRVCSFSGYQFKVLCVRLNLNQQSFIDFANINARCESSSIISLFLYLLLKYIRSIILRRSILTTLALSVVLYAFMFVNMINLSAEIVDFILSDIWSNVLVRSLFMITATATFIPVRSS